MKMVRAMKIIVVLELLLRLVDVIIRAFRKKDYDDKIEEIRKDPTGWADVHFNDGDGLRSDSGTGTMHRDEAETAEPQP